MTAWLLLTAYPVLTIVTEDDTLADTRDQAAAFGWYAAAPLVVFVLFLAIFLLGLGLLRRI